MKHLEIVIVLKLSAEAISNGIQFDEYYIIEVIYSAVLSWEEEKIKLLMNINIWKHLINITVLPWN